MSRLFKWAYSVVFFLLMCGLVAAGSYQYKDNLSIPYNINLFNCVTTPLAVAVSCTSMTLQNSAGTEIFTASNPGSVTLSNSSVTLSGSPVSIGVGDGSDSTQGAKADSPLSNPFGTGSVVSVLKGILTNVLTPISVTGNITTTPAGSPQNVTVANQQTVNAVISSSPANVTVANTASPAGVAVVNQPTVVLSGSPVSVGIAGPTPLNVTVGGIVSPQNVTVGTSPVAVTIASSPVNITGNITASSSSPTTVNLEQVQNVTIASPSTYGVAPVGSVQGMNTFVTNNVNVTPPTPLNVTVGNTASPAGVAVVNNVAVTTPTPLGITLPGSPVSVGIAAGSSPLNVTGSFSTTVSSPLGVVPFNGASPQNVTLAASPVSVAISTVSSPLNVTGSFSTTVSSPLGVIPFNGASPQAVTLSASPVSVAISTVSSPVNVTGNISTTISSPAAMNLVQVQNQNIASPQTYGVAPVGSVEGVNAFVTSLPASPLGVAIAGPTPLNVTVGNTASPAGVAVVNNVAVTTPTPLQVTLPGSPISVGIAGPTPLNVTIASTPLNVTVGGIVSPQNMTLATGVNITQIAGNNIASPTGYGTAPVGSVQGVNAFVTNNVAVTTPTPLQVTLPGTPLNVTVAGPTPLNVTVGGIVSPQNVTLATGTNITQIAGNNIASPTGYGTAPVGSVQGVNAFVTNNVNVTTPTPLGITLPASPVSVGVANSPTVVLSGSPVSVGIAGPTPLNVTMASPVSVAISTVSSPVNVTGSFSATIASPAAMNLVQVQNVNVASPSTYGVAPVGSVGGTNAFVTNVNSNGLATSANSSPVVIASDQTPVSTNLAQVQNVKVASPSTYGVAPVGSVQGVNAFVTNNVNVTTPTPLQVTLPGTPLNVTVASTPLNVTVASTPLNVTLAGTPLGVAIAGATTLNVSQTLASPTYITAYVPTTAYVMTGSVIALGATPGITGAHQLSMISCQASAPTATPPTMNLVVYDSTPHATGTDVVLTTSIATLALSVAGTPVQQTQLVLPAPGMQFTHGIAAAFVQGALKSATAVGANINCSFAYN